MELVKSISLILISICMAVMGQVCLKTGMLEVGKISVDATTNYLTVLLTVFSKPMVWLGLALYGVGSIFWLIVLSRVDLSYAYPMLALSYVAIMLISYFYFGENVSFVRWLGACLVCAGVVLISRS